MLNLNKTKRNIALILALVTVLAMCLVGCTDQEARDAAEAAKKAADAAVTQQQLTTAIENAIKGVDAGISEDEVAAKIEAALADYAKKSDIPTSSVTDATVKAAIEDALKGYAKTADVESTAKKLVDAAIANTGSTITNQATELKNLANSKIDIATWKNATEKVVAKCLDVDAKEKDIVATKANYTDVNYEKALSIFYAAKIRLYRAVSEEDLEAIVADIDAQIEAIPTAATEAADVQKLVDAISFPTTTLDASAVAAAKTAYEKWIKDYKADVDFAVAKGISVGKLTYAVEKSADLKTRAEAINTKIENLIREILGNDFAVKSDKVTQAEADATNLKNATSEAALKKVLASKIDEIQALINEYEAFVGKKIDSFTNEELKKVDEGDKDEVKAIDVKYDNNGVGQTVDGDYVVYFAPVLNTYINAAYTDKYNELKTEAIKAVLEAMYDENVATGDAYKTQITKLGDLFAAVMQDELAWKDAFYQADTNNAYVGNSFEDQWKYAETHLEYVVKALKSNPDIGVNGFVYYIQNVKAVESGKLNAYMAETATTDFAKQVILDCYKAVQAVSATNDRYEAYKLDAINAIAKIAADYINDVATTQRAKDAAKNIVLAYIPAIRAMQFRDGAFEYDGTHSVADKQAQEHFDVLVEKFKDLIENIPDTDEIAAVDYETKATKADAIAKAMSDALTTAKDNVKNEKDNYVPAPVK